MAHPQQFAIGTRKAFENGYPYLYKMQTVGGEEMYICEKGSEWSRNGEFLVLRFDSGTWTAADSVIEGNTLRCRQLVFQCEGDITEPGWHCWKMNFNASKDGDGSNTDWQGKLWAETRM